MLADGLHMIATRWDKPGLPCTSIHGDKDRSKDWRQMMNSPFRNWTNRTRDNVKRPSTDSRVDASRQRKKQECQLWWIRKLTGCNLEVLIATDVAARGLDIKGVVWASVPEKIFDWMTELPNPFRAVPELAGFSTFSILLYLYRAGYLYDFVCMSKKQSCNILLYLPRYHALTIYNALLHV